MNASKSQVNASSAPPINWATRPKQSSGNPVTHLMSPTARRLVPVFVDADQLRDLQEAHLGDPASHTCRHYTVPDHPIQGTNTVYRTIRVHGAPRIRECDTKLGRMHHWQLLGLLDPPGGFGRCCA